MSEEEVKSYNIFTKMFGDVWPNLVVLDDGYWFFAEALISEFRELGECWVQFSIISMETSDLQVYLPADIDQSKRLFVDCHVRHPAINVSKIRYVVEADS